MSEQRVIDLRRIKFFRGEKLVLDDLSWRTVEGQHWFVMGDNGSGKTTLLEILMGYLWPQHGSVSVLGQRYGEVCLPEFRKRIGYVSTWIFDHVYRSCLVDGVVASGIDGTTYHTEGLTAELAKRVGRHLKDWGCADLTGRRFGEISSGEQFKVMLCRALINDPALLILDEPFSSLDVGARVKAYQMLTQVAQGTRPPQIILVTHHFEDIIPVFTHGLFLRQGKIIKRGRKKLIFSPAVLDQVFGVKSVRLNEF